MRSIAGSTGTRPDDPSAEAWAALMRALLCRRGAEQMRADADEAVRRFAAESFVTPTPALQQGIARILCGDLDGGDVCLEDAVSVGEQIGSPEHVAVGLCERSLVAMARSEWDRAEVLADRAGTVCAGPGSRKATRRPWSARCEPVRPCTGQSSPQYIRSSSVLSAATALADLRASPFRRPGPARAGSRPLRARRPGRCQDAHA